MFFCPAERERQRETQLRVLPEAKTPPRTRRNFSKLYPDNATILVNVSRKAYKADKKRYDIYVETPRVGDALQSERVTKKLIDKDVQRGYISVSLAPTTLNEGTH